MKKVIVIGAGIGGLYVAKVLASKNFNVTVFEKKEKKELGYPWYDSIKENALKGLDINLADGMLIQKQVLKFHSPSGNGEVKQPDRAQKAFDINRIGLIESLLNDCEKLCNVFYGTEVNRLLYDDNGVYGVEVGSSKLYADLVIDSSGATSKFRTSLPDYSLLNNKIKQEDLFFVKRCMFKSTMVEKQEPNVYIFPQGIGIAWCKEAVNDNKIDVLTGDFGGLSDDAHDKTLDFLKRKNPNLSSTLLYEKDAIIPVRFPLGVLATNGYVLIGDSAFMTRPICGSGIEATLQSAKHLATLILKSKEYTAESLWEYSVWYMYKYGAFFTTQYIVRYLGFRMDYKDLDWAFTSGILDAGNVALATFDLPNINKFDIKKIPAIIQASKGKENIGKVFLNMFKQAAKAEAIALQIPLKYDYSEIKKWKNKYTNFMEHLI